jgi:para-aminobenzoate synthetase component 1
MVAHPNTNKSLLTELRQRLKGRPKPPAKNNFYLSKDFQPDMSWQQYQQAFERVKGYIEAGDCYQINLAQRFSGQFDGDPWQAYKQLRPITAAPYSAYMEFENFHLLSMSPERFITSDRHTVSTSPIKGTIARGQSTEQDHDLAQQLLCSEKDRAENLMIVDLLRNDLGKCCLPGSIEVNQLFELQSFETVHHLVSTISGQLADNISPTDLLKACFPGGSITGAPKIRAMEIIEELELSRRSAYCGSIGYISCDKQMDTNIAIRTLVCEDSTIDCWAGGGIVADSIAELEFQECFTKVGKILNQFNRQPLKANC